MKSEEIIIQTETVKVRVIELHPGEVAPLHHHSEIVDTMVGISGKILVSSKNPDQEVMLTPGLRCTVEAGRRHQVSNAQRDLTSTYLLIQGVGTYDFIVEEEQGKSV